MLAHVGPPAGQVKVVGKGRQVKVGGVKSLVEKPAMKGGGRLDGRRWRDVSRRILCGFGPTAVSDSCKEQEDVTTIVIVQTRLSVDGQ